MKKYILLLLVLVSINSVNAQLNNNYLYNRIRPTDSLTNEVHLNFYNFNYVRNYEYSNNFHDGYTLYGTQFEPQLVYYAHPNLAITAGAYLRKDFGNERGLYDAKPLFNVKYSKNDLTLVFGSLEGNIQHNYIEPLYNFERKITTPIEYGTQLLIDREKFSLDAWIAWQKMIYAGDAAKEEIVGGFTSDIALIKKEGWKLTIPAQMLVYHQGGQIDALREVSLSTLFNGAIGFTLSKNVGYNVKQIYTNNYVAAYKDFSPTKIRAYQGGFGLWLNAGIDTRWGNLAASYWKGNQFITIKGMPLYQSVSEKLNSVGYIENKRNILMLRYQYQKELLPNLYLDVRFEPHFDLNNAEKNLQFNHSFFLTYKESFKLFKVKK
ncbi:hypothetical protein [Pedobacter xixiisoli]|uniref:Uncharacterized protein n=1 Tax=Pedobacter xixiisoli TaxID=1476464 RepID=A0A286AA96_9SPHI|nr:hypothetical protein [Pedobacter xixiisoli]SOD18792.1 hypothetical protein SAMN06297358_3188 [Pedobacter xixiisoli]